MANEIVVDVSAKLDKINKQLEDLKKTAVDQGTAIADAVGGKIESSLKNTFGSIETKLLEIGASILAAFSFEHVIEAAIEAENSLNRLTSAMIATGSYTEEARDHFEAFAKSLQQTSTVSHVAIEENAALLISMGNLTGDALDRATKAALDFSAGMNISVEKAFNLVAKAAAGNTTQLRRYGITIDSIAAPSERFGSVLTQIEGRFNGLAQSKINTFQGQLLQLKNNFNDFLEVIGNFIIKSPVVVAVIRDLSDMFGRLANSFGGIDSKGDIVGNLIKKFLEFGPAIVTYVIKPLELVYNIGRLTFFALAEAAGGVIYVFVSIYSAIQDVLGIMFEGIEKLGGLVGRFNKSIGDSITNSVKGIGEEWVKQAGILQQTADATLNDLAGKTNKAADDLVKAPFSNKAEQMLDHLKEVAEKAHKVGRDIADNTAKPLETRIPTMIQSLKAGFNSLFTDTVDKSAATLAANENLIKSIQAKFTSAAQAFAAGFAKSFASIGDALVKGQNVFEAFGKVLLGLVGDMAIQVGEAAFLMGLATFNGGQAALGLALIVLGGALKAFAGGGGGASAGSASAASSGGNIASSPSSASSSGPTAQAAANTQVGVHIYGNVLDNRQTGLAIIDAMNEAFSNSGAVMVQRT